jgi:sigma-54 specific flagellar transcriptional regulator A
LVKIVPRLNILFAIVKDKCMQDKGSIYIIDDNRDRSSKLCAIFDFIGGKAEHLTYDNWKITSQVNPDILVLCARTSTAQTYAALAEFAKQLPLIPVILIDEVINQNQDLSEFVVACLSFPFSYAQIMDALHKCQILKKQIHTRFLNGEKTTLFRSLVGISDAICESRILIEQVSNTEASVLILGESGTGKEVIARNIHAISVRSTKPFIPINCGAIPGELLESELFGHEKGAFTGAITTRQGRFELANGGTLFLDEIGDMPLAMQVKLLRVLQERCFERVGSNKSIPVNVRIIAATHRNLEQAIEEGKFREDLFYRLNVFPIEIPPLRERREDISLLFNELIARLEGSGRPIIHMLPEAMDILEGYSWPGNVRELANLVERLSILFPNGIVGIEDLPWRIRGNTRKITSQIPSGAENERDVLFGILNEENAVRVESIDLKEHLIKTELILINQALEDADWVVARAASRLKMRRTTLVEKIKKYGISRPLRV